MKLVCARCVGRGGVGEGFWRIWRACWHIISCSYRAARSAGNGCGNISLIIEGRTTGIRGQRLFLFLKTTVLSDVTGFCRLFFMVILPPPVPSSDFFIISFTDASGQQTCQGHAHNVNKGRTQHGHTYFCCILQDKIDH